MGKKQLLRKSKEELAFRRAIKEAKKPQEKAEHRRIFADWLDDHNRGVEAAIQRAEAGDSRVRFQIVARDSGHLLWEGSQLGNAKARMRYLAKARWYEKPDPEILKTMKLVAIELIERVVGEIPVEVE